MLPPFEAVEYPIANLRVPPYVLGAWLGDGISRQAIMTGKGKDLAHIRSVFDACGIKTTDQGDPDTFGTLHLKVALREIGVLSNKHIPDAYLTASVDQRMELLRGLMDTDGNVSVDRQCFYNTTSAALRDGVVTLIRSLGWKASVANCTAKLNGRVIGPYWRVSFYGTDVASLERKNERATGHVKKTGRYIRFTPIGRADTVCIRVAREDGLFLAGRGYIVTHNSKTEFCSRRLPAYIFGRNRKARIVGVSYGQKLSDAISRDVRRIMDDPAYPFPESQIRGKITDAYWEVNEGEGYYLASGIAGSIGGYGASFAIIDDPYRDASEALSKTIRDNVWEWFTSTLYPRLEKPGSILIVHTRWHEDDLIGRVLKLAAEDPTADQWVVVNYEGIASHDEEHRKKGEALWPWRKTIEELLRIKRTIGRWFEALYQGRPSAEEGVTFLREKMQITAALPAGIWRWVRYWDVASTKDGGDYTVGTLIGQHPRDQVWYVADVVRGQWGPEEVAAIIKQTADVDRAMGRHVMIREEEEGGSSGKAVIVSRTKLLAGYDYKGIRSTGEKIIRWNPFATQVNAGNVFLLAAQWNHDFIDELAKVPGAENDDQADSSSGAFTAIALGSGSQGMSVVTLAGFGNQAPRPGGYKQVR